MEVGESGDGLPRVGAHVLVSYEKQRLWGTVKFAGPTSFAQGDWVGVALDDPVGKNNGTVKDVKYFSCDPQHGVFIRPKSVLKNGRESTDSLASSVASPTASISPKSAVPALATPKQGVGSPTAAPKRTPRQHSAAIVLTAPVEPPDTTPVSVSNEGPMSPTLSSQSTADTISATPAGLLRLSSSNPQSPATVQHVLVLNRELKSLRSLHEERTKASEALESEIQQERLRQEKQEARISALQKELQELQSRKSDDSRKDQLSEGGGAEMLKAHEAKLLALEGELARQPAKGLSDGVLESLRADITKLLEQQSQQERENDALRRDVAQERKARAAQVEKIMELETALFAQELNGAQSKKIDVLAAQVAGDMESIKEQSDRLRAAETSLRSLCLEVGRLSDEMRALKQGTVVDAGDVEQLQTRIPSNQSGSASEVGWLSFFGLSCASRQGRQAASDNVASHPQQRAPETGAVGSKPASKDPQHVAPSGQIAGSTGEA
mmetsp:Transcript_69298/g.129427  ORF Transcript_69298/g.129427 Transcript_69298/m.129427 type:complete len:495 (-) Transcript_69298:16-1500(-)